MEPWLLLGWQRPAPWHGLAVVLRPGLGGAWTEVAGDGSETILFGYPEKPRSGWLNATLLPPAGGHNVLTLALERILFARGLAGIVVCAPELEPLARRGAAVHPAVAVLHVAEGPALQAWIDAREGAAR